MSSEETALALPVAKDLRLVALNPIQLQNSQKELIAWANGKIDSTETDIREFEENLAVARKNKWSIRRPQAAVRYSVGLRTFYEKLRDALIAGYYIVPNFPVDVFAIRTTGGAPSNGKFGKYEDSSYKQTLLPSEIEPPLPPSGEGEYRDPRPAAKFLSRQYKNEKQETRYENITEITGFREVDFPFVLAKPEVLNATQQAMMLKIFDEMAVCPQTAKSDPLVLGIIKAPKRGYSQKQVTFLVAWFLDTNTL